MTGRDSCRIVVEDAAGVPIGYGMTPDAAAAAAARDFPGVRIAAVRDALRPDLDEPIRPSA